MRLYNLDLLKGVLILLVVSGHILQGPVHENIWRYLIYSFHMPLFIGLSGYLCNYDHLSESDFSDLIRKYLYRMILPWGIAMFVYSIILSHGLDWRHILESLSENFTNPYYHLWFIPAFFSWILLSWGMSKARFSGQRVILGAIIISVPAQILATYPEILSRYTLDSETFREIFYTLRPYNYIYFVAGMLLRKKNLPVPGLKNYLLVLSGLSVVFYLFYNPDRTLTMFNAWFFNLILLLLVIQLASNNKIKRIRTLEWLGVNSLAIYLWHVLPLFYAKILTDENNELIFYPLMLLLNSVLLVFYYYSSKLSFFKKYIYGLSN